MLGLVVQEYWAFWTYPFTKGHPSTKAPLKAPST